MWAHSRISSPAAAVTVLPINGHLTKQRPCGRHPSPSSERVTQRLIEGTRTCVRWRRKWSRCRATGHSLHLDSGDRDPRTSTLYLGGLGYKRELAKEEERIRERPRLGRSDGVYEAW